MKIFGIIAELGRGVSKRSERGAKKVEIDNVSSFEPQSVGRWGLSQ